MTDASHTPGPWYVDHPSTHIVGTSYGREVRIATATAEYPGNPKDPTPRITAAEAQANAALLAMAPELLDALERLERACDQRAAARNAIVYDAELSAGMEDILIAIDNARRDARSVISKARGLS